MVKAMNKSKKVLRIAGYVLTGIILTLALTLYVVCEWATEIFNVGIQEILFTIKSPLKGTEPGVVMQGLSECIPDIITGIAFFILLVFADIMLKTHVKISVKTKKRHFSLNMRSFIRKSVSFLVVILFVLSFAYADSQYQIIDYIANRLDSTTIYDDYYVHPDSVNIRTDGNEKNLIFIYLESMETTYASTNTGGAQTVNYIPNLTELADYNISFSDSDKLGGFHSSVGSTWTMGALMATTSGIPFSFPVERNEMNLHETFAPKLCTLGDILSRHNYNQYFLCGSDAEFGGRKAYFKEHGNYNIIDLFTARQKGYIPPDYSAWWGFEDKYLFEIAKQELTEISTDSKQFNFTMLTVDAHHIDGYICSECTNEYSSVTANVVSCTDRLVNDFIKWCKVQPFYKNTAIIIIGDHPRMDTNLVEGIEFYDRTLYNCFINCDKNGELKQTQREFTTMDIFPTTLSALGFEFDGSRAGLGTDMFSGEPTLAEELGFENMDAELSKHSEYYMDNFS